MNHISSLAIELGRDFPNYQIVKDRIVAWYNEANSSNLPDYDLLDDEQEEEITTWLRKNREEICDLFIRRVPRLENFFYIDLASKVMHLSDRWCAACSAEFPINLIPLRLSPQSYQHKDYKLKLAFKAALKHRFDTQGIRHNHFFGKKICLQIMFVVTTQRKDRDVDNMAKLLLDGLKEVIFGDDKNIVHLSLVKIKHEESEELIVLNLRESKLHNDQDVFGRRLVHCWAGAEDLDSFIETIKA